VLRHRRNAEVQVERERAIRGGWASTSAQKSERGFIDEEVIHPRRTRSDVVCARDFSEYRGGGAPGVG
jgi:hypothetical protein